MTPALNHTLSLSVILKITTACLKDVVVDYPLMKHNPMMVRVRRVVNFVINAKAVQPRGAQRPRGPKQRCD